MKLLAPSILSADLSELKKEISTVQNAGADWIHCDIMDGHFVPNITFGPILVKAVKKVTSLPLDVHLMIEEPDKYIEDFIKAGAAYITVHQETVKHLHRTLSHIKSLGAKAGVSLNPATPVSHLKEIAGELDLLLIMSVNPGFGGQTFIPGSLKKISEAAEMRKATGSKFLIEVDGGISSSTISSVSKAGCDVFVAGSSIFHAPDIAGAVKELKDLIA